MRVRRTKKIDRRGLIKLSRRFGIAPVFINNLQRGQVVDLPDDKAEALIGRGYAINAGGRVPVDDTTVDDRDITTTESATVKELEDDDEDDDLDEEDEEDDDLDTDDEDRDIEL